MRDDMPEPQNSASNPAEPAAPIGTQRLLLVRITLVVALVLAGAALFMLLRSLRRAPATQPAGELVRAVSVLNITPQRLTLKPTGYGTARSARLLPLSAEVRGRATEIHRDLEVGALVKRGDTLVQIDATDYDVALQQSRAAIRQLQAEKKRLQKQLVDDKERLELARRDRDLARADFERMKSLYESDTGSQVQMDRAEQVLVQKESTLSNLRTVLATYPDLLAAVDAQIDSAEAQEKMASENVERCTIRAPFDARIEAVSVEQGQYISPGVPIVTLADDSYLEIPVSLEGEVALRSFDLSAPATNGSRHWFEGVEGRSAIIRWVDAPPGPGWRGVVTRVERYAPETRTLSLVVKVTDSAAAEPHPQPLVAGMFCSVEIVGRDIHNAVVIPASAVQFGGEVFLVDEEHRIYSRKLETSYAMGNNLIVTGGLREGDRVVLERLPQAVDGMKARITQEVSNGFMP